MKNIKDKAISLGLILMFLLTVYGVGRFKYMIWRKEHPQTSTWVFFMPN